MTLADSIKLIQWQDLLFYNQMVNKLISFYLQFLSWTSFRAYVPKFDAIWHQHMVAMTLGSQGPGTQLRFQGPLFLPRGKERTLETRSAGTIIFHVRVWDRACWLIARKQIYLIGHKFMCMYVYIYIYIFKYLRGKKGRNYIFPTSLFRESLHNWCLIKCN